MGVPLQMIEFYLILSAVKPTLGQGMFWRLLLGTVVMLAAGYAGEAQFVPAMMGFIVGMLGWGFILYEITAGWSIYPLGYFFGYLMGAVDDHVLNLVYNLADFVNKIAFCLAIWQAAKNSTLEVKGQ